jgi:hypothetical protein
VPVPTRTTAGLVAAIGAFLAVSAWWLAADSSILDFDSGRHVFNTWSMRTALGDGDLLAPITQENVNTYPPLLYLVGWLGMLFGGWQSIDSAMLAMNLVFVPALALGCWAAARIAYGELAGVLAAVFALGTPFVASMFHVYMLDVPQAGAVAATVGLVLASRRFEHVGLSAAAGVAGAAAMLLKPTSVIFLGGLLATVLVRGGWQNARGLAAFLLVGAALAAPWYVVHLDELQGLTTGAAGGPATGSGQGGGTSYIAPPRMSLTNFAWYGWNLLNVQLLAPLTIAFAAGTVVAVVRFLRTRDPADPTPELVIGGLVSYLGMTYISLKDPRYTLPALVYVAALGVAWVPALTPRARRIAVAAVAVVAAVNLIGVSAGVGGSVRLAAPGAPPTFLGEWSVRVYSSAGYIQNAPRDDGDALEVLRAVRSDGIRAVEIDPGGDHTFNVSGIRVLLSIAGLGQPPVYEPENLPPDTVFLTRRPTPPGSPPPCGRLYDGQGLYLARGPNVVVPFESYELYCPPGAPQAAARRPPSASVPSYRATSPSRSR